MLSSLRKEQEQLKSFAERKSILQQCIKDLLSHQQIYAAPNPKFELNQNMLAQSAHLMHADQFKIFSQHISSQVTKELKPLSRSVFSFMVLRDNLEVTKLALQLAPVDRDAEGKFSTSYMVESSQLSNQEIVKQFLQIKQEEQRVQCMYAALVKSTQSRSQPRNAGMFR